MNDGDRPGSPTVNDLPAGEILLERLLARQRTELLERISVLERRRRVRRGALALVAAALALAALVGTSFDAFVPVTPEDVAGLPPLAAVAGDPLEVFGSWSEPAEADVAPALAAFSLPDAGDVEDGDLLDGLPDLGPQQEPGGPASTIEG